MQPGSGRRTQFTASKRALSRLHGFTLIELMVTISIVAIVLALAVPSFNALMNSNRLSGQANEVVASLQLARVEAVRQNQRAIVCPSTNNTSCDGAGQWTGWITYLDMDGNNTPAAAEIIRVDTVKAPLIVRGPASITFRSDGLSHLANGNLVDTTISVCIPTTQPANNRRLVDIGSGSRISTSSASGAGVCP